jgi:hypothetical protein
MTATGCALGAYIPGTSDAGSLDRYAELVGGMPAVVHTFQHWERSTRMFDAAAAEAIARRGAVPMISWEPWAGLRPINRGEYDDYARTYAQSVASYRGLILLRFAHEMNGRWIKWGDDAEAYRSAWMRLRRIFRLERADAVRWVWSPHVVDRNARAFDAYYPGHDQVDWVALDGYNWGRSGRRTRWQTFDQVFSDSYQRLTALAPDKPLMLAEVGCAEEGGDKAAWIRRTFLDVIPARYPAIRSVVWFNEDKRGHADWRVESSATSLAAWREVTADPYYAADPRSFG